MIDSPSKPAQGDSPTDNWTWCPCRAMKPAPLYLWSSECVTLPEEQNPRSQQKLRTGETSTMLKQGTARNIVTLQILIGASQSTVNSVSGLFPL